MISFPESAASGVGPQPLSGRAARDDNRLHVVAEPVDVRREALRGESLGDLIGAQQMVALHMLVEVLQRKAAPCGRAQEKARSCGPVRLPDRNRSARL